jgi:VWFA-related protein
MKTLALAGGFALLTLFIQQQPPVQQQPPTPPTFKSSVDIVPVDVSVVDKSGRPVSDLEAADFTLTVDGKPRRLASAEFISVARHAEEEAPEPLTFSSNEAAVGGRLIALAIDQGNIAAGSGKLAIDAAKRFIDRLNKADRVALYTIPGAGPRIDFTSNHIMVKTLLDHVVGVAVPNVGPHNIGVSEVFGLERNDQRIRANLIDRECPGFRTEDEVAACLKQLEGEARALSAEIRERTRDSILGLRDLMRRLAEVPSPKTLVLFSEGLLIDRDFGQLAWVPELAARGQVSLYVLQIEPPLFDAAGPRVAATRMADIDLGQDGLSYLTGQARGDVFRVTAGADFAFSRIATELSGYYLLSFHPEPDDRDGRARAIRVTVPRRHDVLIRARKELTIDATKTKTTAEVLGETVRSPLLSTDVGVKIATYNFWDAEAQKLRIVIASELDRSLNPSGSVAVAYAMFDEKGALAASDAVPVLETPVSTAKTQNYLGAALVSQGLYTLKLGVVDSSGKRGSVEHAFRAELESAGQVRIGGPLLAEREGGSGPLRPAISGNFSGDLLHAYFELYSDAPEQLQNASVMVEVAQRGVGRTLDSAPVTFQPAADTAHVRVGEAALPIALLSPGDYVVRAVINVFGRKAGQVVRPFRIVPRPK